MATVAPPAQGTVHRDRLRAFLHHRIVLHLARWHVRLPNLRLVRSVRILSPLLNFLRVHLDKLGFRRQSILRRHKRHDRVLSPHVVETMLDRHHPHDLRRKFHLLFRKVRNI